MTNVKLFETASIRSFYDEVIEKWYFSIVDVIEVLTDSINPTDYLKKLRRRDSELGSFLGTNCPQVAMVYSNK
jgi:DNA-damage-inducible protein D